MRFWRDIKALDPSHHDLVISDCEPIIAHAACNKCPTRLRSNNLATQIIRNLDIGSVSNWLHAPGPGMKLHYRDVATHLAAWIATGCKESAETLASQLWKPPLL